MERRGRGQSGVAHGRHGALSPDNLDPCPRLWSPCAAASTVPFGWRCLSRNKKSQTWCDDIEQLRLEILEGTTLQLKRVRLLVYTDTDLSSADRKPLRDEW